MNFTVPQVAFLAHAASAAALHGRVEVVAAGVDNTDFLAEVGRALFRAKGGLVFGHRQRVDVGPHADHPPGPAALEQGDHAVFRDPGPDLEAELAQMFGDELRCLLLAVGELGVLVNLMPDVNNRRSDPRGFLLDTRQTGPGPISS